MDQLELSKRPTRESLEFAGSTLVTVGGGTVLWLAAGLAMSDTVSKLVFLVAAALMGVLLLILSPVLWDSFREYHRYPDIVQKHLQSPLSPQDYDELRYIARQHPEVQPWIAEVMDAEGRILYRDAERLEKRINDYLRTLPQKQLSEVVAPSRRRAD